MDSACSFDLNIIPVDVEKSKHFVDATKYYFVRSQTLHIFPRAVTNRCLAFPRHVFIFYVYF